MASVSADTGPLKPLRRDARRNRERILAAARELFAENGIDTGLNEIAAAAEVGIGTVYRHYPTKDALLDELFEGSIAGYASYAEAALSGPDPWAAFTGLIEHLAEGFVANPALQAIALHPDRGQQRVADASERLAAPVLAIMERAKAAGKLPADFGQQDFAMILTMLAAVIRETRADAPDLWRRYFAIIADGLASRSHRLPQAGH
jgi:AcrR family transcriptional regulator